MIQKKKNEIKTHYFRYMLCAEVDVKGDKLSHHAAFGQTIPQIFYRIYSRNEVGAGRMQRYADWCIPSVTSRKRFLMSVAKDFFVFFSMIYYTFRGAESSYLEKYNPHVLCTLSSRSTSARHAPHECSFLAPKSRLAVPCMADNLYYGNLIAICVRVTREREEKKI
jgi:hypothetical protein